MKNFIRQQSLLKVSWLNLNKEYKNNNKDLLIKIKMKIKIIFTV